MKLVQAPGDIIPQIRTSCLVSYCRQAWLISLFIIGNLLGDTLKREQVKEEDS